MSFETIAAITDNMRLVLGRLGIRFFVEVACSGAEKPAVKKPHGSIAYMGEVFESTHGQRPSYAEAEFEVKTIFGVRDEREAIKSQQEWLHKIKGALAVDALNVGDIAATKAVSRVLVSKGRASSDKNGAAIVCTALIRYRE